LRQNINGVVGELDTLPGCSQVAVSHSVFLESTNRGKGIGKEANELRKDIAFNQLRYDMMICTVDSTNQVQIAILKSNGWIYLTDFRSRKTKHLVELWGCFHDS